MADLDVSITARLYDNISANARAMSESLRALQNQVNAVGSTPTLRAINDVNKSLTDVGKTAPRVRDASRIISGAWDAITEGATKLYTGVSGALSSVWHTIERFRLALGLSAAGIVWMFHRTEMGIEQMENFATSVGLGVDRLQQLRYAAQAAGIGTSEFDSSIQYLNANLGLLQQNRTGSISEFLTRVGDMRLMSKLAKANTDEAFDLLIAAIGRQSPQMGMAMARAVFGRGGMEMYRFAQQNIKALSEEWVKYHGRTEATALQAARNYATAVRRMGAAWGGMLEAITSPLAPLVTEWLQKTADWLRVNEHREIISQAARDILDGVTTALKWLAKPGNWQDIKTGAATGFSWVSTVAGGIADIARGIQRVIALAHILRAEISGPGSFLGAMVEEASPKGPMTPALRKAWLEYYQTMPYDQRPKWAQRGTPGGTLHRWHGITTGGTPSAGKPYSYYGPPPEEPTTGGVTTAPREPVTPKEPVAPNAPIYGGDKSAFDWMFKRSLSSLPGAAKQAIIKSVTSMIPGGPAIGEGLKWMFPQALGAELGPSGPILKPIQDRLGPDLEYGSLAGPHGVGLGPLLREAQIRQAREKMFDRGLDDLNRPAFGLPPREPGPRTWKDLMRKASPVKPVSMVGDAIQKLRDLNEYYEKQGGQMLPGDYLDPFIFGGTPFAQSGFAGPGGMTGPFLQQRDILPESMVRKWQMQHGIVPNNVKLTTPGPFEGGANGALLTDLRSSVDNLVGLAPMLAANAPMGGAAPAGLTISAGGTSLIVKDNAPRVVNISMSVNVASATDAPQKLAADASRAVADALHGSMNEMGIEA